MSLDQAAIVDDLASGVDDVEREQALPLLRELVADWAIEADPMPDPTAVVRFQRESLNEAIAAAGDKLQGIELELLRRRLDALDAAAFSLGEAVIDGKEDDEDARRQGRALLERADQIAAGLDRFGANEVTSAMRQKLGETMLDALYAVERKAMSLRLAQARPQAGAGPPSVSA